MDGIGLLFLIFIAAYAVGKFFKNMKSSRSGSFNNRNLTDTQINFRNVMAQDQDNNEQLLSNNLLKSLTPFQRKLIEMGEYITKNTRPFRFYEWLTWSVELKFLSFYGNMFLVVVSWIILPLYLGVPIPFFITIPIIIAMDLILYRRMRYYEVVKWNPEFTNRFGKVLEDLKTKYK